MSSPIVSVIMPVFNQEVFIAEALESVLGQDFGELELVVVDDGSTDQSAAKVHSYPAVRYFRQENRGVSSARNLGIELAKGSFLAFLDADDVWAPERLGRQVKLLNDQPKTDLVHGLLRNFLEPGTTRPEWLKEEALSQDGIKNLNLGTLLARRELFDKVGGFREDLHFGEDTDWFLRVRDAGHTAVEMLEVFLYRRIHKRNSSHGASDRNDLTLTLLRESIKRRRKKA